MTDKKFAFALNLAQCDIEKSQKDRHGIGRMSERTLHAFLKYYFEPNNTFHEQKVGEFIADIRFDGKIIEIQTRDFNKLRKKLDVFLIDNEVTAVFPIAGTKWLCWLNNETGEVSNRRKSPKRGRIYDFVRELYKIKPYLTNPNIRLCVVFMDIIEYRNLDGWSADKKKGSSRCERIPLSVNEIVYINNLSDYKIFIPEGLPETFTSKEFAKCAKIQRHIAQTTLNILGFVGTVSPCGKSGKSVLYKRNV